MSARLHFKPRALHDARDIAVSVAKDNVDAAERFITTLERASHALADMPEMGRRYGFRNPRLHDVRFMRVSTTFSAYLIFYHVILHGIEIIRILHGARDFPTLFDVRIDP